MSNFWNSKPNVLRSAEALSNVCTSCGLVCMCVCVCVSCVCVCHVWVCVVCMCVCVVCLHSGQEGSSSTSQASLTPAGGFASALTSRMWSASRHVTINEWHFCIYRLFVPIQWDPRPNSKNFALGLIFLCEPFFQETLLFICGATPPRPLPKTQPLQVPFPLLKE